MEQQRDKTYIRSPRDISKIITHAKLSVDELTSTTQTLFYANDFQPENSEIKLLELDEYLLNELKENRKLIIKGKESAVLCTSDRTYDLKEAEISNSMLLIPNLELFAQDEDDSILLDEELRDIKRKDVTNVLYTYIEPKLCTPRFEKLNEILEATKYKGPELEEENMQLFTRDELLAQVEASGKELDDYLRKQTTLVLEGKVRKLNFEYHFRVVSYMLDLIQENSWELHQIDKTTTVNSLHEIVPLAIIDKLFDFYAEPSVVEDGVQLYQYDETKVCRLMAEALLKTSGKLVLNDFLQAWKESVPEGMNATEDMLNGLAVLDREKSPSCIWLLYEEDLPENITERFKFLFQKKARWLKEQIVPYIQSLATKKLDVNMMLTKYARGATFDGRRFYLSKHGN